MTGILLAKASLAGLLETAQQPAQLAVAPDQPCLTLGCRLKQLVLQQVHDFPSASCHACFAGTAERMLLER